MARRPRDRERGASALTLLLWAGGTVVALSAAGYAVVWARSDSGNAVSHPPLNQQAHIDVAATQRADLNGAATATAQADHYIRVISTQIAEKYIAAVGTQQAESTAQAQATQSVVALDTETAVAAETTTARAIVARVAATATSAARPSRDRLQVTVTDEGQGAVGEQFQVYVANLDPIWTASSVIVTIHLLDSSGNTLWSEPVQVGDVSPRDTVGVLTYVRDPLHANTCEVLGSDCWVRSSSTTTWRWVQ